MIVLTRKTIFITKGTQKLVFCTNFDLHGIQYYCHIPERQTNLHHIKRHIESHHTALILTYTVYTITIVVQKSLPLSRKGRRSRHIKRTKYPNMTYICIV